MEKYCFISGASRGVGYEIAKFMASKGYNLVLVARTIDNLKGIIDEIKQYNVKYIARSCNLEDIDSINNMLKSINVDVDIVFNNAGIQIGYAKDFLNASYDSFMPQFLVNTIAPTFITYHFLKKMKKGYIINVTSGINHEPEQPAYSGSKAALDKITNDLAFRYKDSDITISLADPGWCRTDLGGKNAPNDVKSVIPGIVLGAFSKDANGKTIHAQDFVNLSLDEAIEKLKTY
ncbi:MAG: SDR family NAD(P)-dependent oxidoreductase [Acholeplasmatales bacterium]|nr:SDR family NAD(P)-dependent oxidoreductase [Acholeplasmatales bacterium]